MSGNEASLASSPGCGLGTRLEANLVLGDMCSLVGNPCLRHFHGYETSGSSTQTNGDVRPDRWRRREGRGWGRDGNSSTGGRASIKCHTLQRLSVVEVNRSGRGKEREGRKQVSFLVPNP